MFPLVPGHRDKRKSIVFYAFPLVLGYRDRINEFTLFVVDSLSGLIPRHAILEWGGWQARPRDENFLREGGCRLRILSSVMHGPDRKSRGARFCAKSAIFSENSRI